MHKINFIVSNILRFTFLFIFSIILFGCKQIPQNINIIPKPIIFNEQRIALTQQYRYDHYGIKSKSIVIQPRMIVLHWTDSKNFKCSYANFYPASLHERPDIKHGGNLNVSVHFLVDRDGKIYQLMPTNWMARHTIGLNNIAIGIENVGGEANRDDLTMAQVNSNASLIKFLKMQYPNIKYVIGHYEYGKFRHTSLWQEKDTHYFTYKDDPGKTFMRLVRETIKK